MCFDYDFVRYSCWGERSIMIANSTLNNNEATLPRKELKLFIFRPFYFRAFCTRQATNEKFSSRKKLKRLFRR